MIDLCGKTTLGQLIAVLSQLDALIGLDSAPLHLADALCASQNKPKLIALFGATSPGRTGPVSQGSVALTTTLACQPCLSRVCKLATHACMTELLPEQVYQALATQFALADSWQP
jgi:ADP-heptose:LPS heptosyltransferase